MRPKFKCRYCNEPADWQKDHEIHEQRCKKRPLGPNMKRLIAHKMSWDVVPAGSGKDALQRGMEFIMDDKRRNESAVNAFYWAVDAIDQIRRAPDALAAFGSLEEEVLAGEVLRRIKERLAEQRARMQK